MQQADGNGKVTFTTIFPACYSGRMPHIHFEIYRALTTATSWTNKLKTSQLAFPVDVCNAVYATSGYAASVANLARISSRTTWCSATASRRSSPRSPATSRALHARDLALKQDATLAVTNRPGGGLRAELSLRAAPASLGH